MDGMSVRPGIGSVRIPAGVVAMVAILLGAGILIRYDLSAAGFVAAGLCAVLVVLAAIDLERRVIPNRIVVPAAGVVLIANVIVHLGENASEFVFAATASFLVALFISIATRGGVGMGDVKLCCLLGAGLGWSVLGAFLVASLGAAVVGIAILLRHGIAARKQTIPFGPFLALGGIVVLFLS
jgi:prepilin signal peptidase PulO-like enzyme (type II secretory pathway)